MDANHNPAGNQNSKVGHLPVRDLVSTLVDVSWLRPFEGNAKLHPPEQITRLAASISRFGFNSPVLAMPDGTIVAGHGRLMAAMQVGLTRVPCIVLPHLTAEEARAYTLADNRISDLGEWDEAALESELLSLSQDDPSLLTDAGYSEDEVKALLEPGIEEDEMDSDEVPPPFTCPHCGRTIGDDE